MKRIHHAFGWLVHVSWLAPVSLGESWHHNHHTFRRSAVHRPRWWEIDPSALVIRGMERVGLAWNVVRIPEARQRQKLVVPGARSVVR